MAKYILTNKAVKDLAEIWDYTYEVWSESQADKYYKLIIETCEEVAKTPEVGKGYDDIFKGILGFKVGKHIIFYRKRAPHEIEVIRILHERMDLRKRLDE